MVKRSLAVGIAVLALAFLFSGVFLFAYRLAKWNGAVSHSRLITGDFTGSDLITIILSAVTVVLTALAIVLALAGAVGYVTIREALTNAAKREAGAVAARKVDEMVPRAVEAMFRQVSGQRDEAGDDIAKAEGGTDVSDDARRGRD